MPWPACSHAPMMYSIPEVLECQCDGILAIPQPNSWNTDLDSVHLINFVQIPLRVLVVQLLLRLRVPA